MEHSSAYAPNPGQLSDAAARLTAIVTRSARLADETAWQCAAAQAYRTDLAAWVNLAEHLKVQLDALEWDARNALWRAMAIVG